MIVVLACLHHLFYFIFFKESYNPLSFAFWGSQCNLPPKTLHHDNLGGYHIAFPSLKLVPPINVRVLSKGYFFLKKHHWPLHLQAFMQYEWDRWVALLFLVVQFVRWWQDVKDAAEMLGFVTGVTAWTVSLWYGSRQRWNYSASQRNCQLSSWFTESVVKNQNASTSGLLEDVKLINIQ